MEKGRNPVPLPNCANEHLNKNTIKQRIWLTWEKGMEWILALRSEHTLKFGICKVMVKKYSGDSILCEDGTWIDDGDRIGELHLNNGRINELTRKFGVDRAALKTAREVRASMKEIGEALDTRMEMAQVKALVGVTLLHRGLTHGLGFEQHRLPSKRFEVITTLYLRLLMRFMHPDGLRHIDRNREKLTPILLVSSRSAFCQKFNPDRRWFRFYPESTEAAKIVTL